MTDTVRRGERMVRVGSFALPLWASVFAALGVAMLVGLGLWQLERLQWKENLIAAREARLAMERTPLPAAIDDPASWHFRPVEATGQFEHGKEALLAARSLNGNVGYHVVTPLRRQDGATVLVDRGWIPLDRKDPLSRPDSMVPGEVTVRGIARTTQDRGYFVPDDVPEENFWFVVDIPGIAEAKGLDDVLPVFVEAAATAPGTLPVGGQTRIRLPNDHLQYAITWFGLALALIGVYAAYVRQRNRP